MRCRGSCSEQIAGHMSLCLLCGTFKFAAHDATDNCTDLCSMAFCSGSAGCQIEQYTCYCLP